MGKRKICVISPAFAPCTMVGAARMTSLVGYFIQKLYSVTVISAGQWNYGDDLWSRVIPDGINLIELNENDYKRNLKYSIDTLMARERYDICISSMGPFDTQKFLWKLCKKHGIPFILDYRDAWLWYPYYYTGRRFFIKVKRFLLDFYCFPYEWANVKNAAAVVTVTDGITKVLQNRYKKSAAKICTIMNGHEKMSFYQKSMQKENKCYRIGCIGKFLYYDKKKAIEFINVVKALNQEGYQIKVMHIGEKADDASQLLINMGIQNDCYEYIGKKKYEDSMYFLCEMDASLII